MNEIKKLANRIGALEGKLQRSNEPAKALASEMQSDMDKQLNTLLVGMTYSEGAANAVGTTSTKSSHQTATLIWRGSQIKYLEFGTGIVGASSHYPNQQLMTEYNYRPRPNGHSRGIAWVLPEQYWGKHGEEVTSIGWKPYKPMYNIRKNVMVGKYNPVIEESVHSLIERWI